MTGETEPLIVDKDGSQSNVNGVIRPSSKFSNEQSKLVVPFNDLDAIKTNGIVKEEPKPTTAEGFLGTPKPVFLNEHQRKFANPISYLGGPRLPARNRWSVESVLSLD